MDNVRTIYLDWNTGGIVRSDSGAYLARQYDHLSNLIVFRNAPGLENYYLIVEMKEGEDDLAARSMEPIMLPGPYWLVPNVYTQLVQPVTFQVCCKTESGDFEQHSAKFKLNVIESLRHDGADLDVDPSPMFDAYEDYVDEKVQELIDEAGGISIDTRAYVDQKITEMVAAAGEVIIDSTLSISGAAADAKATGDAISETNERLDNVENNSAKNTNDISLTWTLGKSVSRYGNIISTQAVANVSATLDYIPIKAGDIYAIKVYAVGTSDNVVFYDSEKAVVEYKNSNGTPITYTVEQDGYMRLSNTFSRCSDPYVRLTNPEYKTISDLTTDIDTVSETMDNAIYNYDLKWTDGGFLNSSGGISSNSNYAYTADYYPVVPGMVLDVNLRALGTSDVAIWFYTSNKVRIQPPVYTQGGLVTVPDGAAYLRCSTDMRYVSTDNAYIKTYTKQNDNLSYFIGDRGEDVMGEAVMSTYCTGPVIRKKYEGNINRQKRFLCIGFDDLRSSDLNMIMPLFEKYRARATFNAVFKSSVAFPTDTATLNRVFMGGHELGDHTFLHYSFPYFDPLYNGQNPASPDGTQTPYPSNSDFRDDAGNGKNALGKTLTSNVNIGGVSGVTWENLTDAQCQTIREAFSVMKHTALITILDNLSNKYLGTSGSSNGSWDDSTGKYTGGIFTGCATSANHEIWERILECVRAYVKNEHGINWDMYTWSRPGGTKSDAPWVSPQERFVSSLTGKDRSWTDVLLAYGYRVSHDYPYADAARYNWISRQFIFNAALSKRDAISIKCTGNTSYNLIATSYPESFFSGTKSKAAQMYDVTGQFRTAIESIRQNTTRGMIHGEMIDSQDNYSSRVFFENLLRYCESAGIEVITKAEAYDICYNNYIYEGNFIGNPDLVNTAAEFITDSENMPTNPDGYTGDCSVSADDNGIPVLVTTGETREYVYGVPFGKMTYSVEAKGSGTIKLYALPNNLPMDSGDYRYTTLGTATVSSTDYTEQTVSFVVPKAPLTEYDNVYEGYGNRIMGVKIVYSAGLNVKNIRMVKA